MTDYTEYWDYLDDVQERLRARYPQAHSDRIFIWFKLTASPYHYWLENRALQRSGAPEGTNKAHTHNSPKASEVMNEATEKGLSESALSQNLQASMVTSDAQFLAVEATKLRSKLKTGIRAYHEKGIRSIPMEALGELTVIANDHAPGLSLFKAVDCIPDSDIVKWNQKHGVFV